MKNRECAIWGGGKGAEHRSTRINRQGHPLVHHSITEPASGVLEGRALVMALIAAALLLFVASCLAQPPYTMPKREVCYYRSAGVYYDCAVCSCHSPPVKICDARDGLHGQCAPPYELSEASSVHRVSKYRVIMSEEGR